MLYRATGVPLVDTGAAVKIFAAGLGKVDVIGQNARFAVFMPDSSGGTPINIIEAYVTMPIEAVGPAIELTLTSLGITIIAPPARYIAQRLLGSGMVH